MNLFKVISFVLLTILLIQCQCPQDTTLTVASYNIRYKNKSDSINGNDWNQRAPIIAQLIKYNNFDIIGAQEVLNSQLKDMLSLLPEYSYIGVGRDDGKTAGEYAPIFYKRSLISLKQSGHFWLSENTEEPNIGWDAALPRICTWAEFIENKTNKHFWFFNLHMDHIGTKARKESAKLVLKKIKEMCNLQPVILTGDFNVDQHSDNYSILANSLILNDSYKEAQYCYALNGTFNNFDPNLKTDSRIDHIFVGSKISVSQYGILTDTYRLKTSADPIIKTSNSPQEIILKEYTARTPSDHFPVRAVIHF